MAPTLHAKVMYESLDPQSIPEHLAYYELYNYPPALEHAWKLLSGDEGRQLPLAFPQNSNAFIALINPQDSKEDFIISDEALATIQEIAKTLPNRKRKGYNAKTLDELLALNSDEIDLARALLIGQLEDKTSLSRYEAMLDLMALQVMSKIGPSASPADKVRALNTLIFYEQGFRFPPHSTYSQTIDRFTFLPHVLESRRGVCLGVSALYICLAERIGLDFEIITPPGHIFIKSCGQNIETTLRGVHIHDDEYLGINLIALPKRTKKEVVGMAFFNQASIYLSDGNFEKAASCYRQALPFMQGDKMLYTLLAASLYLTNHDIEAKRFAKEAMTKEEAFLISQNRLSDDIYYNRADKEAFRSLFLYVDETRASLLKKRDALQKAVERCPTFYSGIFTLAITQLQLNRPQEAVTLLEKLACQTPDDITVHYYLAELHLSRYNAPAAWASFHKAEALAHKKGVMPQALTHLKTLLSIHCPQ